MPVSFELVVCITSTALFDCSESHEIWKNQGLQAYQAYQHQNVDKPLKPGVGFPLVQSLLALNKMFIKPLIDVVLVSRNDSESGERLRLSILHHKLNINRMSFTAGTDVTKYLSAWKCDLFLSTEKEQVRSILAANSSDLFKGIAAALVFNMNDERLLVQSNLS